MMPSASGEAVRKILPRTRRASRALRVPLCSQCVRLVNVLCAAEPSRVPGVPCSGSRHQKAFLSGSLRCISQGYEVKQACWDAALMRFPQLIPCTPRNRTAAYDGRESFPHRPRTGIRRLPHRYRSDRKSTAFPRKLRLGRANRWRDQNDWRCCQCNDNSSLDAADRSLKIRLSWRASATLPGQ